MIKSMDYTNNKTELFSLEDMIEYINVVFNILSGLEMGRMIEHQMKIASSEFKTKGST